MKLNGLLTGTLGAIATLAVSCTANVAERQTQQEIKLTGAATPYPAMKALAAAYEAEVGNVNITFLPPSQSSSGIKGVQEGLVDLGTVTRKPKPEEDDGTLVYREVARDALTVATHPDVKDVTDLNTDDLKAIYSGEKTNWQQLGGPDAQIVLLDRAEDESAKRLLRKYYLGKDLKNAPDAAILRHENDLIKAVTDTPYSIGAFSLASALSNQLEVNRLSLDGVAPTLENVQSGQYQMVRNLGIVSNPTLSEASQKFLDFIFSDAGAEALQKAGFVPSGPPQE